MARTGSREPVEIGDVCCEGETDLALKCSIDTQEPFWVPKSLIHEDSEVQDVGDDGILVVPEWFAVESGLV